MNRTSLRRLAAGASAAALVSAGAFFGSSAAFAQPTPEETETATESAVQSTDTGAESEDTTPADETKPEGSAEKQVETKAQEKPATSKTKEPAETGANEPTGPESNPKQDSDPAEDGDDDASAFDPQVSSAPDEITAADLANRDKGISITASNLQAGDVVTDSLTNESNTAEGEELTTGVYYKGDPSDFEVGEKVDFTVTVSREGEESKTFDFTVTIVAEDDGDDAPAFDPQVSSAPDEITAADLANPDKGISITASNLQAGDVVTDSLTNESNTAEGEELTTGVYYKGDPSDFEVGEKVDFTVTVSREGEESKTFDFTVTIIGEDDGDDETMEPELKISPQKISVTDFRNENKGVQLTVTNCYPGEAAAFIIEHENGELSYEVDADTNNDGTAVIEHIHGTGNAPDSAYTGTYTVTVICGDGESDGTFSVHADDNGKGGGDSDKGRDRDRNELPRTGSDLTALYGAASLLAVGAAAIVVGRRKSPKQ